MSGFSIVKSGQMNETNGPICINITSHIHHI